MQKYVWIIMAMLSGSGLYAGARAEASNYDDQYSNNQYYDEDYKRGNYQNSTEYNYQSTDKQNGWQAPDAEIQDDWYWRRRPYRYRRDHWWWRHHRRPWPRSEAAIEGNYGGGGLQGGGYSAPGQNRSRSNEDSYYQGRESGRNYSSGRRSSDESYFKGSEPQEQQYYYGSSGKYNRSMHPNRAWQRSSTGYRKAKQARTESRPSRMKYRYSDNGYNGY